MPAEKASVRDGKLGSHEMAETDSKAVAAAYTGTERRQYVHIRDIFEEAYRVAYPLLDPAQNSSADGAPHFLRIVLREAFPSLHQQDISILSVAIVRVFRERSRTSSL